MPLPRIAIVGRPNVGKSRLLNRLARRRVSIVDPTPGVTRDRVGAVVEIEPPLETPRGTPDKLMELIDTGGYGVYTADGKRYDDVGADLAGLTPHIESQIRQARAHAHLVLFVIDAQAGITGLDQAVARLLRQEGSAARVLVVANKVDGESWVADGLEAAALGFGEPLCVSAENGFGMRALFETLYRRVDVEGSDAGDDTEMKLAIVGKRNSGKSTLINALAGEPRVIVSEIAGTTRDAVDVRFEIDGHTLLAIDTAGLRKRKSFADDIEYYAYHRMLQAVRRGDIAVLLIDATQDVSQVDKKLSQELVRQFKPTIIAVNKCDLVESKLVPDDYVEYLTRSLWGLEYAPIVFLSAERGEGVRDVVSMAFSLYEQSRHRVGTGELNAAVERILKERGPTSRLGTQAKLYFATQVAVAPPTLVLMVNDPSLFRGQYERYLLNSLRDELPFSEIPIRVIFRPRTRIPLQALKDRQRNAEIGGEEG